MMSGVKAHDFGHEDNKTKVLSLTSLRILSICIIEQNIESVRVNADNIVTVDVSIDLDVFV